MTRQLQINKGSAVTKRLISKIVSDIPTWVVLTKILFIITEIVEPFQVILFFDRGSWGHAKIVKTFYSFRRMI